MYRLDNWTWLMKTETVNGVKWIKVPMMKRESLRCQGFTADNDQAGSDEDGAQL